MITITYLGLAAIVLLAGLLCVGSYVFGVKAMAHTLRERMERVVPDDMENMIERALSDAAFFSALRHLYSHEEIDINGGDLVQAVGLWAADKPYLAIAEIEAMLPCMQDDRP